MRISVRSVSRHRRAVDNYAVVLHTVAQVQRNVGVAVVRVPVAPRVAWLGHLIVPSVRHSRRIPGHERTPRPPRLVEGVVDLPDLHRVADAHGHARPVARPFVGDRIRRVARDFGEVDGARRTDVANPAKDIQRILVGGEVGSR